MAMDDDPTTPPVPRSSAYRSPEEISALGEAMRIALRQVAMPITVVLMRDEDEVRGATVTSFMPISLDPPTLAVGIGKGRWLHSTFASSHQFTINVLGAGQEPVAMHFASSTNRATGVHQVRYGSTPAGLPTVEGALVTFSCVHRDSLPVGDHTVHVVEVLDVQTDEEQEPLLWHDRRATYLERRR